MSEAKKDKMYMWLFPIDMKVELDWEYSLHIHHKFDNNNKEYLLYISIEKKDGEQIYAEIFHGDVAEHNQSTTFLRKIARKFENCAGYLDTHSARIEKYAKAEKELWNNKDNK